jgi:hypothetical protein
LDDEKEIFTWTKHNDHFFLNQKGHSEQALFNIRAKDVESCKKCLETRKEELARAENLFKQNGPLQGLELFSGEYKRQDISLNFILLSSKVLVDLVQAWNSQNLLMRNGLLSILQLRLKLMRE